MWNPWTDLPLITDNQLGGLAGCRERSPRATATDAQFSAHLCFAQTKLYASGLEDRQPRS